MNVNYVLNMQNKKLLWHHWAKIRGEKICLLTEQKKYNWSELKIMVDNFSYQLTQYFQRKNQQKIISVITKNNLNALLIYLAGLQSGITVALIAPDDIDSIIQKLNHLKNRFFYTPPKTISKWHLQKLAKLGYRRIFFRHQKQNINEKVIYKSNENSNIIFTSGSAGKPKAIIHTFYNHYFSAKGLLKKIEFRQNHCWALTLPLYHISGLAIIWRWLYRGAILKIPDNWKDLEYSTHASLVPAQLHELLKSKPLLKLETVLLGGGYVDPKLAGACVKKNINTWVGYGLTEATSTVCLEKISENNNSSFSGELLNYRKLKIINKQIYVGGKVLAKGYLRNGKLYKYDSKKMMPTGDLGEYVNTKDSHQISKKIRIIGRVDNLFISGGKNIYCEEIENQLQISPKIISAIVIPVATENFGAQSVAIIDSSINLARVDFSKILSRLPKYKHPIKYLQFPKSLINNKNKNLIKPSRFKVKKWFFENHEYNPIKFN